MRRYGVALLAFLGFVLLMGLAGASDRKSLAEARYQSARVHVAIAQDAGE